MKKVLNMTSKMYILTIIIVEKYVNSVFILLNKIDLIFLRFGFTI
jgi:hypothetical protein